MGVVSSVWKPSLKTFQLTFLIITYDISVMTIIIFLFLNYELKSSQVEIIVILIIVWLIMW